MNSIASVDIERRLHHGGIIADRRWAIARAVSVCRMRLNTINKDPIDVVGMTLEIVSSGCILLTVVVGFKCPTKAQAGY